jgi:type I restriction enzyme S subunit
MSTDKNKLIPELRFPEFANEREWVEKALGEVANIVASGDLDKDSYSSEPTNKHTIPIYSNSVSNEGLYGYNTYSKFQPNSVTITARGTLGVAFVRNTEFIGIGRLLVASDLKKIDSVFLKENWNHYAEVPIENGGIPQLTAVKAKRVSLLFPKFEEQQKIASCLSSLDEVIAAQSQKLATLKDHKKGLMQNLFPTNSITNDELEITNVPNYRFPEFLEDGEWEGKSIGEFAPLQRGFDLPVDNIILGKYPVVFSNGISKYHAEYKVKAPGIVTGRSGTIGKVTYVKENFWPHNTSLWVTDFCGNIPMFVFYYFILIRLEQFGTGSGVPTLNRNDVHRQIIFIPKPKEQQKIAFCLSSLDELITAQTEKIAQLKLHKKGLMQGLFPRSITN